MHAQLSGDYCIRIFSLTRPLISAYVKVHCVHIICSIFLHPLLYLRAYNSYTYNFNFSMHKVCLLTPGCLIIIIPVCLFILDKSAGGYSYYFENILTITLLLINEIQILFCLYMYFQELQFDHHFIVLWQLFQHLEGGTLIRFWKFGRVIPGDTLIS